MKVDLSTVKKSSAVKGPSSSNIARTKYNLLVLILFIIRKGTVDYVLSDPSFICRLAFEALYYQKYMRYLCF